MVALTRPNGNPGGSVALSITRRDVLDATLPARPDDVEAWRERSSATARRSGFLRAWEKHLPEIVHLRTSRALSRAALNLELYRWIREDRDAAELLSPETHAHIALALTAEAVETSVSHREQGVPRRHSRRPPPRRLPPEVLEGDGLPMKMRARRRLSRIGKGQ